MRKNKTKLLSDIIDILIVLFILSGMFGNWYGIVNIPWKVVFLPICATVYAGILIVFVTMLFKFVKSFFIK